MKYNKYKIMKNAWSLYRNSKLDFMGFETQEGISFREALKAAWAVARAKMAQYEGLTPAQAIEKIEGQIFNLNMIDRWTSNDQKKHDELQRELNELRKAA